MGQEIYTPLVCKVALLADNHTRHIGYPTLHDKLVMHLADELEGGPVGDGVDEDVAIDADG